MAFNNNNNSDCYCAQWDRQKKEEEYYGHGNISWAVILTVISLQRARTIPQENFAPGTMHNNVSLLQSLPAAAESRLLFFLKSTAHVKEEQPLKKKALQHGHVIN